MMTFEEITRLIDELYDASEAYYQSTKDPIMSDEEFDTKLDYLKTMSSNKDFQDLFQEGTKGFKLLENEPGLGTKAVTDEQVKHEAPMLSLKKAKTESELLSFLKKMSNSGAKDFVLQAKLDGFALSAQYVDGKLEKLATRGDGTTGDDITYILNEPNLSIIGLPRSIEKNKNLSVRGEVFFSHQQFIDTDNARFKETQTRFKNPRAAVVGVMKKAKIGLNYPSELTFSAYSAFNKNEDGTFTPENMSILEENGFETVIDITKKEAPGLKITGFKDHNDVFESIKKFGILRNDFNIPTDGIVVKPSNEAEMIISLGNSAHSPHSQIAFKYPSDKMVTTVQGIDITVGKTGRLTPIARLKPEMLSGSLLANVSLHNFHQMFMKNVRIGSVVSVTKAGEVIPYLESVISNPNDSKEFEIPTVCPICKTTLESSGKEWPPKTLKCVNHSCESRYFFILKTAVMKKYLDIDGLSEVLLTHLYDNGIVKDISDFYKLTEKQLAPMPLGVSPKGTPRRLGEARAKNIIEHIEKSKTLPLHRLLASLGIESLGETASKVLVNEFKTLEKIQSLTSQEISAIPQFGVITSEKIVHGLKKNEQIIAKMISSGVVFNHEQELASSESKVFGLSFSISGPVPEPFANRQEFVEFIESNGGIFHASPKKDTMFMIADPQSNSSKIKKALDLGIQVLNSETATIKFFS